jgi:hypothetical protein
MIAHNKTIWYTRFIAFALPPRPRPRRQGRYCRLHVAVVRGQRPLRLRAVESHLA